MSVGVTVKISSNAFDKMANILSLFVFRAINTKLTMLPTLVSKDFSGKLPTVGLDFSKSMFMLERSMIATVQ